MSLWPKSFKIELKREIDRILILHYLILLIILFAFFVEGIRTGEVFFGLFKMGLFYLVYRLYIQTIKRNLYSYWTFSFFLAIFFVISIFDSTSLDSILYLFALFVLLFSSYLLSSPLFYPRVHWWEYDFRFREDLKIEVFHGSIPMEGRLADLRQYAGCVVLFKDIPIGEYLNIKTEEKYHQIGLKGEIYSKREYLTGRGITYGVKFHFASDEDKKSYKKLRQIWNKNRKIKRVLKYK